MSDISLDYRSRAEPMSRHLLLTEVMMPDVNLNAPEIRYIKLGRNGAWARRAIATGEIPFSHQEVPHELAKGRDQAAIAKHLIARGSAPGPAASAAREICEFYGLGRDTIWITFADGRMWWARAEPEVIWRGTSSDYAPRIRRTIEGWRSEDLSGQPLLVHQLGSRLTKVAGYRQTLCRVGEGEYLRRKLEGLQHPLVQGLKQAQGGIFAILEKLITELDWADFETLIDLLLDRGGWHRVSALGGSMKDADLVVQHAISGETAFVQVKSQATDKDFQRYLAIFDQNTTWSRFVFACHSPRGEIETSRSDVLLWTRTRLAEIVYRNGLIDWVISRSS